MKTFSAVVAVVVVLTLCACDGQGSMLPKSGGRPYEVLVVSGRDGGCGRQLVEALSQDAAGLPQPEPQFDVSLIDSVNFNQTARLARAIVIVTVNPEQFTQTRIRYEKNVWARPQMVAYVNTPSVQALRSDLAKVSRQLAMLFTRAEINAAIARLSDGGNGKASDTIAAMFGWSMKVPADMKAGKRGDNFIWLSNNASSGMRNLCVYSYPGDSLVPARALAARDSVMKANIPGERDGMYMQTAAGTMACGISSEKGRTVMIARGLWEMRGDAMGGPFVSHSIVDTLRHKVIVAEAFVYAPEMKKRNLLRQVEAALYTLAKADKSK